jgi:hypothetical protein
MSDEREVSDFTALCFEGDVDAVLKSLTSVDWKLEGVDPLHWAIKGYRPERMPIIEGLLISGSPVDGHALYLAGRFHPELLGHLPDPDIFAPGNAHSIDSALLDAARTGRAADILRFINLGANPETADYFYGNEGWNSLHLVCHRCDWPAFQALFTKFFNIHRLTNKGQTALMLLDTSKAAKELPNDTAKIREQLEIRAKNYPT